MPDFIPNQNTPNFREVRSQPGDDRLMFARHWIVDEGRPRMVHPASGITLGSMRSEGSEEYQPTIRIDYAFGPTGLVFVPNAEELRALGEAMLETANQMVKDADDLLSRTLSKRSEG